MGWKNKKRLGEEGMTGKESNFSFPFSSQQLLYLALLVAGLILGFYICQTYFQPSQIASLEQDFNVLQEKNSELDSQLDTALQCLDRFKIDRKECIRKS